ncbi:ImmA/IrrE family metallo-endopeptidase [Streptomyces hygroscopicus subsp. hygroscopicus]|uniref:helix-turn-helix domain-containing protein n=1 Tax=Streptomyces hygroscopicus TaxID=1912 RepID=UPI001C65C663|nr:XRE family transcriptional regulator [Streptomyces hygroscopicus]MBW8088512.1 ImmA/IrrE family metallo-endopeptidase [Streptomyces hygroscopicus subsp. hygroscopicus]
MIHGERVKQVREMHQMTQSELANAVPGVSQYQLSRIEKGSAQPDEETEALLAATFGVTIDFLRRPPSVNLEALSPQLRARSRLTQRAKTAAMQWAKLVYEEYKNLSSSARPIPCKVPVMRGASPADAAAETRSALGFTPNEPLPYLILAVERAGVTVLGLPFQTENLDGFCAWRDTEPIIAVLSDVPGYRVRFTVAHELGHLVLHEPGQTGSTIEAEADAFAAELLTPRAALAQVMPTRPTLNSLAMLKTQWGVSIKSLVRGAREIGVIDQERAISLYKQISARGWNRQEPGHVPQEKPRAFRKLLEIHYGANLSTSAAARGANWSEELAMRVLEQHATVDELPHAPVRSVSNQGSNVIQLRSRTAL